MKEIVLRSKEIREINVNCTNQIVKFDNGVDIFVCFLNEKGDLVVNADAKMKFVVQSHKEIHVEKSQKELIQPKVTRPNPVYRTPPAVKDDNSCDVYGVTRTKMTMKDKLKEQK